MLLELLDQVSRAGILIFVVSSMTAIGFGHTIGQILAPLRSVRLLLLTLLANFVVLPLASLAVAIGLRLDEPLAEGLLLLGAASGAPFVPRLTEFAQGNLRFAIGAMVLLTIGTIVYVPVILPLLLPNVTISPLGVARPLLLFMFLPLSFGLGVRAACRRDLATWLKPMFDRVSNASLVLVLILIPVLNIDKVLHIFGTRGILAAILLIFLGLGVGWLLGGPGEDTRRVLALSTGLRNFAVALVVASQSFDDPRVEIMVIVTGIIALLIVVPLSRVWGVMTIAN
jgi:BASS family bile acid:Na+ symporter